MEYNMSKKTSATTTTSTQTVQDLSQEQEIGALRSAHQFFSNFPNVPGHAASNWGQALDALAVVANSLISKAGLLEVEQAGATTETSETGATETAATQPTA